MNAASTRAFRIALRTALALSFASCEGDKDPSDGNPNDTSDPSGPQSFTFNETIAADAYTADIAPEALAAHQVSSVLLASAAIVSADEKVQDRLNVDGGGPPPAFRAAALDCWSRPEFPMFSFSIDYTPCSTYQMGGGVFINDHPSGPLLYEFEAFKITDREIGGVLAFDTREAYPSPLFWQAYNTEGSDPGLDNPVQIGVKLDNELYGVSYSGGAAIDFAAQEWSMWGVMTVGIDGNPFTVVHGASSPDDISPDEPTGADVLKSSLNWLECRCPQSGISSLDMPLVFTSVTVDIDKLEDVPDVIDDPEMEIEVDFTMPGRGVLTHTGCGIYDVEYEAETALIPVTREKLAGAISFQCATLAIDDEQRCDALLAAAGRMSGDLMIEVTAESATLSALAAVEADFDTAWCLPN